MNQKVSDCRALEKPLHKLHVSSVFEYPVLLKRCLLLGVGVEQLRVFVRDVSDIGTYVTPAAVAAVAAVDSRWHNKHTILT